MIESIKQIRKKLYEYEVKIANRQIDDVSKYLTDDFIEYGSSGSIITYDLVVDNFKNCSPKEYLLYNFEIEILCDDIVQAKYITSLDGKRALRSSLWKYTDGRWKMFFHQGTKTNKV